MTGPAEPPVIARRRLLMAAGALIGAPALAASFGSAFASAQDPLNADDVSEARRRSEAIVTAFYGRLRSKGLVDQPPPSILIAYTPARTSYSPSLRQITAPAWSQSPSSLKEQVASWAAASAHALDAKSLFEEIYNGFMIAHEATHAYQSDLGFWNPQGDLFESEIIANRGAIAFALETPSGTRWITEMMQMAQTALAVVPSPVPQGQDVKSFFNENAAAIADDPAQHGWFEARMMTIAWRRRNELNFDTMMANLKSASA